MIKLAYSTFGLTGLPLADAIDAIAQAGYEGAEIAFHRRQFNIFDLADDDLDALRQHLRRAGLPPACVATASHFFTPSRPHEPSLLTLDRAGRRRRIDLIKRGIRTARRLGTTLVTFGSGFLREEHVSHPGVDPRQLLAEAIDECLREIHDDEDLTLLIEPEPGMFIETLDQGVALIDHVNSPHFALHIDLCHAYCSEPNYLDALGRTAARARYLHISDAQAGWNLKLVEDGPGLQPQAGTSTLVYFPQSTDFLLVDPDHPRYFCEHAPDDRQQRRIQALLEQADVRATPVNADYTTLYAGRSPLDDEIFTYLISVPRLSFDVLERARPIIAHLRGVRGPALFNRMVANTITGIVHFHDIPGRGTLDLAASFDALNANGFEGYGAVELYHHVGAWQQALHESHAHLAAIGQRRAEPLNTPLS